MASSVATCVLVRPHCPTRPRNMAAGLAYQPSKAPCQEPGNLANI